MAGSVKIKINPGDTAATQMGYGLCYLTHREEVISASHTAWFEATVSIREWAGRTAEGSPEAALAEPYGVTVRLIERTADWDR